MHVGCLDVSVGEHRGGGNVVVGREAVEWIRQHCVVNVNEEVVEEVDEKQKMSR